MSVRGFITQLIPPVLTSGYKYFFTPAAKQENRLSGCYYTLDKAIEACSKNNTEIIPEVEGWNHINVISEESKKFDQFKKNCHPPNPLGFSHEAQSLTDARNVSFHNIHLTFGYVIGLASQKKDTISVLDYGGGLGHYYFLAKTLYPDLTIHYVCKEMPNLKSYGEKIAQEIEWFDDDSCLNKKYDIVLVNGSLQYLPEWKHSLSKIIGSVGTYFFLTRVPVVDGKGFYAIQQTYGTRMIHQQFNQQELFELIENNSLRVIREFIIGDKPYITKAPEQCELKGWLFMK